MSVLRICAILGCETRTLGQFCVAHETSHTRRQTRRQPGWRSTPPAARTNNPPLIATTQQRVPVGRADAT